jgi:hypothetical protein
MRENLSCHLLAYANIGANLSGFAKLLSHSLAHFPGIMQGCQIFLGTKHQNGEKYTKLPQTMPNVHKM